MRMVRRRFLATCLGLAFPVFPVLAQQVEVDVALVLAIDCSFSVDVDEFGLQMQGMGQAFRDPSLWEAVNAGRTRRIAVSAFQWSDNDNQFTIIPWMVIDAANKAARLGEKLEAMPRRTIEGGTSITNALLYAETLFEKAPAAFRKVVDVSTDGRNNIGAPLPPVRSRLLANDITINALAIINEFPNLDAYAEQQIIGGHGSFVVKAKNYDDYGAAILRKLIKEITGPGIV